MLRIKRATNEYPFVITPEMTTSECSRRMKDAGYPLDTAAYSIAESAHKRDAVTCPYCLERAEAVFMCASGYSIPSHVECMELYYHTGVGAFRDYGIFEGRIPETEYRNSIQYQRLKKFMEVRPGKEPKEQ